MTGQFGKLVDVEGLIQAMIEQQLFPACRTCDNRPPPPNDDLAEQTILAHAIVLKHLDVLTDVRPEHFMNPWNASIARLVLPPAEAPPLDDLIAKLDDETPGSAATWTRLLENIARRAPALCTPEQLRARVVSVVRLASRRECIRIHEEAAARLRVTDLDHNQSMEPLRQIQAVVKGTPTK